MDHSSFGGAGPIYLFRASKVSIKAEVPVQMPSYTIATLPDATIPGEGALIYVTDATGGAVLAFSDGTDWRRSTDRTVII